MQKEYWTERQYNFLKKCCNTNLRQFSIQVPDGDGGYHQFHEVVFENVLPNELVIIAKQENDSMRYEIVSEHFRENHHIMPAWVRYLMRVVYDNYLSSKKLEK